MKLYYKPGACSLAAHIALLEAGVNFSLVEVDLKTKLTKDGADFNKISSKGYVPVLELDNGEILTEGTAILQYIADLKPNSDLAPANGTIDRVRMQEWLGYINSELHKNYGGLFYPDASAEWRDVAKANLNKRFAFVNEKLEGKKFITGDKFTIADAYIFVTYNWSKVVGLDLSHLKNLDAFVSNVARRPAVMEAMKAEGLTK